ncbi:hypothetical protein AQUCO_03200033v1 [Aquilegia coerulea]|uniref:Neprosin PEP catalytic domain-containing protein n=1 Tax=Aquilegia coerulea TaxID=218851 RepID=A0A2G5CZT5_AQUCA|nr:hypothetical protein AQUCO_03200033v1 [Aquilegia coerulea]
MAFKVSVTFLLVILFGSVYQEIEASRNITRDNDFELEEQLRILNKPPIKSIKDETGALYDCIDINKQPALDHPLLKDHKIQMTPTSFPKGFPNESPKQSKIELQHVECPQGTVPIRRIRKKDLITAKYVRETQSFDTHPSSTANTGQHIAGIYSAGRTFKGAQAYMNVPNPQFCDKDQVLSAYFEIANIATGNMLFAGWTVNPSMYGDNKARSMIYWKGAQPGCINLHCKGFVLVNNRVPVDAVLQTSVYDGQQWEFGLKIHQDMCTKNWWVTHTKGNISIGYWPNALVPGLRGGGSKVAFMGYVVGPLDACSPPMGFGKYPEKNFRHSGYFVNMLTVNKTYETVGLGDDWSEFSDKPKCYRAKYYGEQPINGYSMEYGGPGGDCNP